MDKHDFGMDATTNSLDRKQPLKTTVSMPILGQRTAVVSGENRLERRPPVGKMDEVSALPDGGDDDDLSRPALTKSTSCYYVQQTGEQPSSNGKPSRANDQ
ncbi:hypothetical protein QTP88_017271 [Uroleucon formosanum]